MNIRDVSRCLEQCCDNCLNISLRNCKNDHMSKSIGHCSTKYHERFEFFSDFTSLRDQAQHSSSIRSEITSQNIHGALEVFLKITDFSTIWTRYDL